MTKTAPSDPFGAVGIGERHRVYSEMARTGPVHRLVLPTGVPAWLITGYEEVRSALNDARLVKFAASPTAALMQRERPDLARAMDTHMLCCDGPEHARLRGLVGAVFTRRRVEAFAPRIQQIIDALLDAFDPSGPTDLVAGFAYPLAMTVICELVGIPETDREPLREAYMTVAASLCSSRPRVWPAMEQLGVTATEAKACLRCVAITVNRAVVDLAHNLVARRVRITAAGLVHWVDP